LYYSVISQIAEMRLPPWSVDPTLYATKIQRPKFAKSQTGSDVSVQLPSC